MKTSVTPRPIVKWAGGKGQLLPALLPRIPLDFDTYCEPFAGGAALFFALYREGLLNDKHVVLNDLNKELVLMYQTVRDDVEGVIARLKRMPYEKDFFYEVRGMKTKDLPQLADQAARFIYLNKTCFNGLYRVNKKGEFNVSFGRYTNPTICDEENLRAVSTALQTVVFRSLPFEQVMEAGVLLYPGSFVYCDPPYVPLSETANFTSFTVDGFTNVDQVRLRDRAQTLGDWGIRVLLSNSDTPFTRHIYEGFDLSTVMAKRSINRDAGKAREGCGASRR